MNAMILAAGMGTRLLPHTLLRPKPLFTISGRPVLDRIIRALKGCGCDHILINTHHLHEAIEAFLASQHYGIAVRTCFEPKILGTGGAVKNVADLWRDGPLLVVNGDIVTDIDFRAVWRYHQRHGDPVTLVCIDFPRINTVSVDAGGCVAGFTDQNSRTTGGLTRFLTFTGIQVVDPEVATFIPEASASSIIDAYRAMMAAGRHIRTFLPEKVYWMDIGTPERYRRAVFEVMAPEAFIYAFPGLTPCRIGRTRLEGDGSDRKWYRLTAGSRRTAAMDDAPQGGRCDNAPAPGADPCTLIMADHGIHGPETPGEADAFVSIGRHLHAKGLPVPEIHHHDTFSGCVFLEDLGDLSLQKQVQAAADPETITAYYHAVIDGVLSLSLTGSQGFDPSWTHQSARYDKPLILEKECRYFVDAYVRNHLGLNVSFEDLKDAFSVLADGALKHAVFGFMHRDMQSRNIFVKHNVYYFIDFQGGRIGPIQYDLASLLIDPYVALPRPMRAHLLAYSLDRLFDFPSVHRHRFEACFLHCAVTRNLQILGAFATLSRVKKKPYFKQFIPPALHTLREHLLLLNHPRLAPLTSVVERIVTGMNF